MIIVVLVLDSFLGRNFPRRTIYSSLFIHAIHFFFGMEQTIIFQVFVCSLLFVLFGK